MQSKFELMAVCVLGSQEKTGDEEMGEGLPGGRGHGSRSREQGELSEAEPGHRFGMADSKRRSEMPARNDRCGERPRRAPKAEANADRDV